MEKQSRTLPGYYYDVLYGQIILGGVALDTHIEAGGHPADIREVEQLLVSDELDSYSADYYRARTTTKWTREDCTLYGRFLVRSTQEATGEPRLNKKIIRRAHIMGLGISPAQIAHPDRSGSLSRLYRDVDKLVADLNNAFSDLGLEEIVNYLAILGSELGRKPTEEDINAIARKNKSKPSSYIITQRCGQLRYALEMAGWPNIYEMNPDDHINHGVKFMFANDGLAPTQLAWDFLSKQKKGPSAATMRYKFSGGFSEMKSESVRRYDEERKELQSYYRNKGREIQPLIDTGELPIEIFKGAKNPKEIIKRHAMYRLVTVLSDELSRADKKRLIASVDEKHGFLALVRLYIPEVTTEHVEAMAAELGIFNDIWPMDSYMTTLRIVDDPEFIKIQDKRKEVEQARDRRVPISPVRPS